MPVVPAPLHPKATTCDERDQPILQRLPKLGRVSEFPSRSSRFLWAVGWIACGFCGCLIDPVFFAAPIAPVSAMATACRSSRWCCPWWLVPIGAIGAPRWALGRRGGGGQAGIRADPTSRISGRIAKLVVCRVLPKAPQDLWVWSRLLVLE